jgi:hypothetical protein
VGESVLWETETLSCSELRFRKFQVHRHVSRDGWRGGRRIGRASKRGGVLITPI